MNDNYFKIKDSLQNDDRIDLVELLNKVLEKWYIFLICAFIGVFCAYAYSKIIQNEYQVETTVLIQDEDEGLGIENMFDSNIFGTKNINIINQIGILGSFTLCKQTLENLDWKIYYFRKGLFSTTDLYRSAPFHVVLKESAVNTPSLPIYIDPISDSTFKISVDHDVEIGGTKSHIEFVDRGTFGKLYENRYFSFIVSKVPDYEFSSEYKYFFFITDFMSLIKAYHKKLEIGLINEESDLIKIKLIGNQPQREVDFLNELSKVYIEFDLDKKNRKSENTVKFIDLQLSGVIDSLQMANNSFTDFRSRHQIMDLSQEGTLVVERLKQIEYEESMANLEYEYYKNLLKYLDDASEMEQAVAPSVVGITDPILNSSVAKLSELYSKRSILSISVTEKNPALIAVKQEIEYTKQILEENLRNLINNMRLELDNFETRKRELNRQLYKLPQTEQDLVNIKRDFDINNNLYTFLLQKRAESAIVKASNVPNAQILDIARVETAVPLGFNKKTLLMLGFMVGVGIPLMFIVLREYFNLTLSSKKDVEKHTNLSVLGDIFHNSEKLDMAVIKNPKSPISESFRKLRTNLKYVMADGSKKVIAVHSSVQGEGKTFVAVNLALIIAMSDKKVLLVDADLRRPRLYKIFNCPNSVGLSNYLIRQANFGKIIIKTEIANLSIVLSGPIPPNPAELIESETFDRFIQEAKENFDYIIIDNPPSLLVTDGTLVSKKADLNLFVIRLNTTYKGHLKAINEMGSNGMANKIGLVVNDIRSNKFGIYSTYGSDYYK